MRPLLQHASRSLTAHVAFVTPSARLVGGSSRADSSICQRWQNRAASTPLRRNNEAPLSLLAREKWLCRPISSSARWMEERKPPQSSESISMPPPASEPVAVPPGQAKESSPPDGTAQSPVRTQDELNILLEKKIDAHSGVDSTQPLDSQETTTRKNDTLADNITRVPDEQLPSHGERQRWAFSKRFSEVMDDLLPKLATVTQKVNNYTGTDYSGVEALRREIKEQENLVKARRGAIDTSKHALDTAHAQQASAQKEVVALLERKHSWSAGDLERYMSLIRSEHLNDQAIRLAKESVIDAESALEEARTQLEKRERAQYHEEQIWSDTIRRNSTWVTFGLMGVNIFLLLLSLAILEPWRRRRMVREIKSALAANNKVAAEAVPIAAGATVVAASINEQDIALIEEEIDRVTDDDEEVVEVEPATPAVVQPVVEKIPIAVIQTTTPEATAAELLEPVAEPIPETEIPLSLPHRPAQEYKDAHFLYSKSDPWQEKVSAIAQDIVSERVITMRRVDYTTAILQGAAVGAVIMAAIVGMLGSN